MPVLLLCRGEKVAKDMLRQAIEARYGQNPPAIESVTIDFEGRSRVKLGPVKSWVPVEAQASFVFPSHLRWDFTVKPLGFSVQKGIEAYDGKVYRTQRRLGDNTQSSQTDIIASARGRLWQMAAILLTPMSDYYIEIKQHSDNCIEAINTKLNDSVHIYLRDNFTIESAVVECWNPDTDKIQTFTLRLSDKQSPVDGLMLPEKISAFWDNEPYFEISPTRVDMHPTLPDDFFTLGQEAVGGS